MTLSLANGRSEAWVAARTGHESRTMINRYRPTASSFQEINAGALVDLDLGLPELRGTTAAGGVGHGWAITSRNVEKRRRPQGDSNPCYSLERAVSWAGLDDGDVLQGAGR